MTCELFVGNLNPDVRVSDLENLFGRYGKVTRCDMKKNYAFVAIGDKGDGEEAIRKENNRRLLGSVMTVEWAKGTLNRQKTGGRRSHSPPPPPRKPRSPLPPSRFNDRARHRSPIEERGRAPPPRRDRSPVGRGAAPPPPRSRDDRFNGSSGGGRYRDSGANGLSSGGYGGDRGGDRYSSRDSFGDRGLPPPPSRGGDRGGDRGSGRDHGGYGERRFSGGGGRRF